MATEMPTGALIGMGIAFLGAIIMIIGFLIAMFASK
jgi:hypothetical protein